jgi:DNA modification methylase
MSKETVNKYYCVDARKLNTVLRNNSIDVTITSPPYGSQKDYGSNKQIGYGQSYEEYLASLEDIFNQVFYCTRDSGSLWVVADTFKNKTKIKLLPFDLIRILEGTGWKLRDIMIWNKTKTLPWSRKGQLRNTFEYIIFLTKTNRYKYYVERIKEPEDLKEWWVRYPERYSPEGKVPTNIWTFPIPVQGSFSNNNFHHACPFPRELVERILLLTTDPGDCVLDPFAGSGVVLAQAYWMQRRYVGFDVNRKYVKQFHKHVKRSIGRDWKKLRLVRSHLDSKRQILARQILKLREVKFPKALFNLLKTREKRFALNEIQGILAIYSPLAYNRKRYELAKAIIYILCDGNLNYRQIERKTRDLLKRPPLSKYGIVPEVHATPSASFLQTEGGVLLGEQDLFIYTNGATYMVNGKVKLRDWLSKQRKPWKRVPPILTNIEVHQPIIRTWKPKNGEDILNG